MKALMNRRRIGKLGLLVLTVAPLLFAAAGCREVVAEPELPPTTDVSGVITLDGRPLPDATVDFIPDGGERMGQGAFAITDENGAYELSSAISRKLRRGAIPGNYRVRISRLVKADGTVVPSNSEIPPANLGAAESLPPRFSDFAMTELRAEVPILGGTFDFDVSLK